MSFPILTNNWALNIRQEQVHYIKLPIMKPLNKSRVPVQHTTHHTLEISYHSFPVDSNIMQVQENNLKPTHQPQNKNSFYTHFPPKILVEM